MSSEELKPAEVAALFALMAEAREVSNSELKDRYGFSITGAERTRLEKLGLVQTRRSRSFIFELTNDGWTRCRDELAKPGKPAPGIVGGSLAAVLAGVHRYLERKKISLAEVFRPEGYADQTPQPAPVAAAPTIQPVPVDAEPAIRAAYAEVRKTSKPPVRLALLRPLLGGFDRADVDAALVAMLNARQARLVPEENRKTINAVDRDAAIHVGGQAYHYLAIGDAW